jgi:hypothetical protein
MCVCQVKSLQSNMDSHFQDLTMEVRSTRTHILEQLALQQQHMKDRRDEELVMIAKTIRECSHEQQQDMAQQFSQQTGALTTNIVQELVKSRDALQVLMDQQTAEHKRGLKAAQDYFDESLAKLDHRQSQIQEAIEKEFAAGMTHFPDMQACRMRIGSMTHCVAPVWTSLTVPR